MIISPFNFKSLLASAVGGFLLLAQFAPACAQSTTYTPLESADLILHNGFVWTVDEAKPQAETIAIRGENIIKVGSNAEVIKLKGANTRLIDLKGNFVVPGFNDNHVHFASAA